MKAKINNVIYNINTGWNVEERNDEQFNSALVGLQKNDKQPFSAYEYVELWEENDSSLGIEQNSTGETITFSDRNINTIYLDIDLGDVTTNWKLLKFNGGAYPVRVEINAGKLILISGSEQSETGAVLTTGRQRIIIAKVGTLFEMFVNGEKQVLTTPSTFVDSISINKIEIGDTAILGFSLYDLKLTNTLYTERELLEIAKENYTDSLITGEFVYNDFRFLDKVVNKGTVAGVNMTLTDVFIGKLAKSWNFFTQVPESGWFDREDEIYIHQSPLIELVEWFTTIDTPVISILNPVDGTPKYNTIKDMLDHIYDVTFLDIDGVNLGFLYDSELTSTMSGVNAFDKTIPEGNLYNSLRVVYDKLNGYPKITKIENGRITLGIKFKSKVNNEIRFNDYDDFKYYNPNKGYGTMGVNRGLNVVNTSGDDNKNTHMFTEETPMSMRSESVIISETSMVTKLLYPIEEIYKVTFIELDNPTNTVDLTPFVVLDSDWRLLKSSGWTSGTTSLFKQNTIRYEKGGKKLFGWDESYYRLILPSWRTWKEIITSAQNLASVPVNVPATWEEVSVIVQYGTRSTQTMFRVAKEDISTVKRYSSLQTSQGGNIVDSKALASVLHSDIQSSGNLVIEYSKSTLDSIDDVYEVNDLDTITNSFIKYRKITGFQETYDSVYILTENYQSISDNLDISASVREYNIPQDNKAVESVRFYEDYIEWNLEGLEANDSSIQTDGISAFMRTFGRTTGITKKYIDNVVLASNEIVNENGLVKSMIVPVDSEGYRNTMKLFFGFEDAFEIYPKKGKDGAIEVNQGVSYKGTNGYLDIVTLQYGLKHTATDKTSVDLLPEVVNTNLTGNPLIEIGNKSTFNSVTPLTTINYREGVNTTVFARNEDWTDDIPTDNITASIQFLYEDFDDDGDILNITYTEKVLNVVYIDDTDNVITLPQVIITPNIVQNIVISDIIKQVNYEISIAGEKAQGIVYNNRITTSLVQEITTASSGLKVKLDAGDIWLQNYFAHNVFYKTTTLDIGEIIIGDEAMINNVLMGGLEKNASTELFIYESDRYGKYEREFVKGSNLGSVASLITFTTQSITLNTTITDGKSWAMGDSNGNLLFAVNPPRDIDGTPQAVKKVVSHNYVHFRTGLTRDY